MRRHPEPVSPSFSKEYGGRTSPPARLCNEGSTLARLGKQAINLTAAHDFIPQSFPARELLAPGLAWPQ